MFNDCISINSTIVDSNCLLLTRVRIIVKFYIWPLVVLFGLTGNLFSIIILTRRRLIRTSTNNYLTALAAFDSCYLLITTVLNFGSHPVFNHSLLTQKLLYVLRPLADFSSNTATWLIVCFTLERTLAVAKPIYAKRRCSVRRSRRIICTLLLLCFLITLPTYFESDYGHHTDVENITTTLNTTQEISSPKQKNALNTFHRLYLVFICVTIIWIPLAVLCICNSVLIWFVHRSRRFRGRRQSGTYYNTYSTSIMLPTNKSDYLTTHLRKASFSSSSNIPLKYSYPLRRHSGTYAQKHKVTVVLIFCLCVALVLWTPQSLSLTYETLIESYSEMSPERRTMLLIFNNFANLFLCINASIDFILYCFLSEKFARTCRQIICRKCSVHTGNSSQRSRLLSIDRTSYILTNVSNITHHQSQQQQQQQQLTCNKIVDSDTQLCQIYHHGSTTERKRKRASFADEH